MDYLGAFIVSYIAVWLLLLMPLMIYRVGKWEAMIWKLQKRGIITHYEGNGLSDAFCWQNFLFPYWWNLEQCIKKDAWERVNNLLKQYKIELP
ncbi:hypothetical protein L0152_20330 [bacterium]|nr:hypothetical protein [bacterium]